MQEAAGFGAATAGWIAGWNYLGYLVGALGAAFVAGRALRAEIVMASIVASVVTTAAMGFTTDIASWCALRFVAGLASAGVLVLSAAIVMDALLRAGRPQYMGAHFSGVGVGIALSGLIVLLGAHLTDWRGLWFAFAGAAAALAVLALPLAKRALHARAAPALGAGAVAPAQRFPASLLVASYFLEGVGYVVTGTFLVALAKQMPALGGSAELLWIAVGLAGAPSSLLWVRAAQRWGAPEALIAAHLVQAAGIVVPVFFDALWIALLAAVCFGGTLMGITAVAVNLGGRISAQPARMIGLLTAAFGLGQMIGPVIGGWLAERHGNFDGALLLAAGAVALGALLLAAGRAFRRG
jgi:MFS family permease